MLAVKTTGQHVWIAKIARVKKSWKLDEISLTTSFQFSLANFKKLSLSQPFS